MNKKNPILFTIEDIIAASGVTNYAFIQQKDILYDRIFRDICASNACGNFGMCHMCPPDIGDIDVLMAEAQGYCCGFLYQTISDIEDSFDFEGMILAGKRHNDCAQHIRKAAEENHIDGILHLASGGCRVCERCSKRDQLPCRFPGLALSSLEAYGVNVHKTAENVGLKYINGPNTVTYFGMILIKEDQNA